MVTVDDIFHKIAQDFRAYTGVDQKAAVEEFILGCRFDLHLAITTDMEETELDFMERYGHGHTFYFRLASYEHGKRLAGQMYWVLMGRRPDMKAYTGEVFEPDDRLYLFVHLRNINPPPVGSSVN
jgi:hypothetical protein